MAATRESPSLVLGRYAIYGEIASGGMATVHFGRQLGAEGFARTVAIKRLHASYAKDPQFVTMFLDEGRLVARIRHPNVVPTLDVVANDGELFIVLEYVHGESLARLLQAGCVAPEIICPILAAVLHGLHAAHEATGERGEPLGIVHRDVSPQNVLVGLDGVARILDFGVAKAAGRATMTSDGRIKGKVPYMPPEQILGSVDRRADIYAAGVILWEALAGRRLFQAENEAGLIATVLGGKIAPPSEYAPGLPASLVELTMRALAREPRRRFATAREMARALERTVSFAVASDIGDWVERLASERLRVRARRVKEIESLAPDSAESASDTVPHAAPVEPTTQIMGPVELPTSPDPILGEAVSTQLSSGSSAPRDRPPSRPSRRVALVAVCALVPVLALAWKLLSSRGAPTRGVEPVPAGVASLVLSTPPQNPADPAVGSSPEPRAEPPPIEIGASPVAGDAAAASSGSRVENEPPSRKRPPARRASCAPPYAVDSAGFRHYKPECMD